MADPIRAQERSRSYEPMHETINKNADLEKAPGYTANAESQWSRHAAAGQRVLLDQNNTRSGAIEERTHADRMIAQYTRELGKLYRRMATADPALAGKTMRQIETRQRAIAKYRRQQIEQANGTAS